MRAIVVPSARFAIDNSNRLWALSESIGYEFWTRYLDVYEEVYLLVRAYSVDLPPEGATIASGVGIHSMPIPYYHGPLQYLKKYRAIVRAISQYINNDYAIHLRVPVEVATPLISDLPDRKPYGVEVVGDPYDVFAPGAVRHPLRPFLRWWFAHSLRRQCMGACASAYVTAQTLQKRYPPRSGTFTTHYSSVELNDAAFAVIPRVFYETPSPTRLIMVGSLEQMYKAPDILLQAVAICVSRGLKLELTIVGRGKHWQELNTLAQSLNLGNCVHFLGQLPAGAEVREQLDRADLFVLPSRQEGLPRAMIEAMARGLPCIGSTIGGIPELLPTEDMVPPNDVTALASKIEEVVRNPTRMTMMAARNLEKARNYHENLLRARRIEFYQYVKHRTEMWIQNK